MAQAIALDPASTALLALFVGFVGLFIGSFSTW